MGKDYQLAKERYAAWDMLCEQAGVPDGHGWLKEMEQYEETNLAERT